MANEFERPEHLLALVYSVANVGAGTTPVDGIVGVNGKTGFVVPTGMAFVPVWIDAFSNAARTAGTNTFKVTDNGTEVSGGPEATLDATNTTADTGIVTGAPVKIAAGHTVGVSANGDGSFAPTTADADVILYGYLQTA